jgi:putative intracellular protease/amidase
VKTPSVEDVVAFHVNYVRKERGSMIEGTILDEASDASIRPILMPLPDRDFDPTEAAIPWKTCTARGFGVAFSTENGSVAEGDLRRLEGPLPGLLSASRLAREAYRAMTEDPAFGRPIPYERIDASRFQGLLLPGGDALGVRQYLDSPLLRSKVLQFSQQSKLIGAMCHGVLVLARTIEPRTGRSVVYGHKVTAPPKWLDRFAYLTDRWLLKHGYIMYERCVADEVRTCVQHPQDLSFGPSIFKPYVVRDGMFITSRWYLDAELFAQSFVEALGERAVAA